MKRANATKCIFVAVLALVFWVRSPKSRGQSENASKQNNIPVATAEEMKQLNSFLRRSPEHPAALFLLAMDYATI